MFVMDLMGTVAFAFSGAMLAIKKRMDVFGVNILALTTAVGGGVIRDLIIGQIPPVTFRNPVYALAAVLTANVVFWTLYLVRKKRKRPRLPAVYYEKLLFWMDTLGLAAFTVEGTMAGAGYGWFLMIFVGALTGVGGGVLRDMMAGETPSIFVKRVYACASLAGAAATSFLWEWIGREPAMVTGFVLILIIRLLAAHFCWDLPRIL
ncbi:MAG: trimeric intracellular cation channel family protein [Lachnospiraceae bacterium]|nr:trimeric intracellular cation channel family protein [Lachnospiraceae bacterium]